MPTCPYCQSADVASSRAVYESGASVGKSRGAGIGAGGGGAFAGMGRSKTVTLTLAAKRNAPPRPKALKLFTGGLVQAYEAERQEWLRTWYCFTCGEKFTPADDAQPS